MSCKKTSEARETALHSQLNHGHMWWTDLHVDNMAKMGQHIYRSMGCCPVPVEWDHPETTSGHCEPWKQLIGLRRPRSSYTKCLERGWVATIWYHSIHEWTGTYGTVHIHILLRNRNHVAVKRSCMLKTCTSCAQQTSGGPSFPFPGCEHVGQTLPRISFTSCISTFERASPPWQMALALLQEMFHCGLRPSIVTYNSAISVARTWMRTQQFLNLLRQWSEDPCFSLPSQNRMLYHWCILHLAFCTPRVRFVRKQWNGSKPLQCSSF